MQDHRTIRLSRYFLALGATGFGGPVALVARMRRELVEEREWVSESDFREGLALSQVAPGPLAAQLAMYIGWLDGGPLGAALAGFTFVLPSLIIVLILAEGYRASDGMPVISMLFYGVGAAVIAVIARSGVRLARSTIQGDPMLWFVALTNATATVMLRRESIPLVFASGLMIMLARSHREMRASTFSSLVFAAPAIALPAGASLAAIFLFFAASGLVVFGSGLAIIPFLHGGVVLERHWLTEQQFLDAVAVSLLTPGPVVITVAFIGSLVAGISGGIVAAAGVFLPAYAVVVLVAPHFRRIRERAVVQSFASGVTAAAIGALLGAVGVMAMRTLVDTVTVVIAIASLIVLIARPRIPEPAVLAAAAVSGLMLHWRS
jgi:chromate transporter